jgi:hypothetical protein
MASDECNNTRLLSWNHGSRIGHETFKGLFDATPPAWCVGFSNQMTAEGAPKQTQAKSSRI